MIRIVDTVADACQRTAGNFPYFAATAADTDAFINTMKDVLLGRGWTLAASGTETGHPFYKLDSAQSPWWDPDVTPPAIYNGRVRVKIKASSNSLVRFQCMSTDETFIQNAAREFTFGAGPAGNWRYIVTPCQFVMMHATGNFNWMVISAIHTPRWFQEAGLEECFICTGGASNGYQIGLYSGGNQFYRIKSAMPGLYSSDIKQDYTDATNGPRVMGFTTYFGGTTNARLVNPEDDSACNDATKRAPFHIPAAVALPVRVFADQENSWRWLGWYWDGIVMCAPPPTGSLRPHTDQFDNGMVFESMTLSNSAGSTLPGMLMFRTQ